MCVCFCTDTSLSSLVSKLECACAAVISDLLNVIRDNLSDAGHVKNEALLVELECKVLIAAGEGSRRDRKRVHTQTV